MICKLQETCKHFTNGTKRKSHHIRITDVRTKLLKNKCSEGYDIAQGPACAIKVRKLGEDSRGFTD